MFFDYLVIGVAAIIASVTIHTFFTAVWFAIEKYEIPPQRTLLYRSAAMALVVLWFLLSISVQCWAWAALLLWMGALPDLDTALYFSTVTFTTLGYGDVVLDEDFRILGAFQAANGTIIIGWTTAMVFVAVQRLFD